MAVIYTVYERYLSQNPIVVTADGLTTGALLHYTVTALTGGYTVFEGVAYSITGRVRIDLSTLFSQNTAPQADVYRIMFSSGGTPDAYRIFTVYSGGISGLLQRKIAALNKTIFELKLIPANINFLLSTRSFSRYLFIPENELMPLYYYTKGKKFEISHKNTPIRQYDHSAAGAESVGVIDFDAIRKSHFYSAGSLVNAFDVKVDGTLTVFSVIITQARPAACFIKFRNSFLAFEKTAINDVSDAESEFTHTEISNYDAIVNRYVARRKYSELTTKLRATVTAANPAELLWIIDMLLSPEQYFCTGRHEYPVLVKAETPVVQTTRGEPLTIELEITLKDTDTSFSPADIDTGDNRGIFSEEFNDIFY